MEQSEDTLPVWKCLYTALILFFFPVLPVSPVFLFLFPSLSFAHGIYSGIIPMTSVETKDILAGE